MCSVSPEQLCVCLVQMDRFACLYSSHVSNLAYYSPDHMYGGKVDYMVSEPAGYHLAGMVPDSCDLVRSIFGLYPRW